MNRRMFLSCTMLIATLLAAPVGASEYDDGFAARGWLVDDRLSHAGAVVARGGRTIVGGSLHLAPPTGSAPALLAFDALGHRDPTFGTDGLVRLEGGNNHYLRDLILLDDGSVVAGLSVPNAEGAPERGRLVKLRVDGSVDTGFGAGGTASVDRPVTDLDLAPDGAVIVATSVIVDGISQGSIQRYSTNGVRDDAFGWMGSILADRGVTAVEAVDADTFGWVENSGSSFTVSLRKRDGSGLSRTFQDAGNRSTIISDSRGRLVLPGTTSGVNGDAIVTALRTFDLLPEPAFGAGGSRAIDLGGTHESLYSIVEAGDGTLVATGGVLASGATTGVAVRLHGDGTLDTSFASAGVLRVGESLNKIAADGGHLSVAGRGSDGTRSGALVARFGPDTPVPGYRLVARDGGIFAFAEPFLGSTGGMRLNQPIVGMATDPHGSGYWLVASDGGIFAFGGAPFSGSTGDIRLNQPIVGMAANPHGPGYWLVASDGGIFAFGGAPFYGSTGHMRLNQPIVGMAANPHGPGYWLVASDGGIFAFGAPFHGSTGHLRLNQPIVGMAANPKGGGYWFVASDGGIFAFGGAPFAGSTGGRRLNSPIVGMAAAPYGGGYWLVAADGGTFSFGNARFMGSLGALRLNQPIVGIAA